MTKIPFSLVTTEAFIQQQALQFQIGNREPSFCVAVTIKIRYILCQKSFQAFFLIFSKDVNQNGIAELRLLLQW